MIKEYSITDYQELIDVLSVHSVFHLENLDSWALNLKQT